jgi:broad specificity phosphatase PhoE
VSAVRLVLVRHAPTAAVRSGAFGAGDGLDARGRRDAAAWAARVTRPGPQASGGWSLASAPEPCARETAAALGAAPRLEQALAECDFGRWRGRTLDAVAAEHPDGLERWLGDPAAAPHGGEPLAALAARASAWLDALPDAGRLIAITHATVVRALVAHVLGAPPAALWRIDVAPLAHTELRRRDGRWTVRSVNCTNERAFVINLRQ